MLEQSIETLTVEIRRLREVIEHQNDYGNQRPVPAPGEANSPLVRSQQSEPAFIDEKTVAWLMGISVATVRRWRLFREGPPYIKIGSSVRYSRAEVMNWPGERRRT